MGYVVSRHGSNLLVAAEAADERTISHALDQLRHGLFLDVDHNEQHECLEYKVRLRYAGDKEPVFITAWRDDTGRPLPLSTALVEHVKMLIETDTLKAADEHNERMRERAHKDAGDEVEAIAAEMLPWMEGRRQHFGVYRRERLSRTKHLTVREAAAARADRERRS